MECKCRIDPLDILAKLCSMVLRIFEGQDGKGMEKDGWRVRRKQQAVLSQRQEIIDPAKNCPQCAQ